jgi:tetratricopeptide (TPR) repeat protein
MTARQSPFVFVLVIIVVMFCKTPLLYLVWNFNQASLNLIRWSLGQDGENPEKYLFEAVARGEQAGNYWLDTYNERVSAKLETIQKNKLSSANGIALMTFTAGIEFEAQGNIQDALVSYQNACQQNNKLIQACSSAYSILVESYQVEAADSYRQFLIHLEPDYAHVPLEDENIKLLGYDLQTPLLERDDEPLSITIYWDMSNSTTGISEWSRNGWSYIQVGSRLYQMGKISNLLPNYGFDRDFSNIAILPYGYQNVRYSVNQDKNILSTHHRLEVVKREQEISQAAVVVNSEEKLNGLTTKQKVDISPTDLYILSGLMRVAEGGSGSLGGVWRTQQMDDINYWYISRNSTDPSWVKVGGVERAPANAEIFTLLALNTGVGEVYFDNLMFFRIPYPEKGSGSVND